jgi:hypothetical protein
MAHLSDRMHVGPALTVDRAASVRRGLRALDGILALGAHLGMERVASVASRCVLRPFSRRDLRLDLVRRAARDESSESGYAAVEDDVVDRSHAQPFFGCQCLARSNNRLAGEGAVRIRQSLVEVPRPPDLLLAETARTLERLDVGLARARAPAAARRFPSEPPPRHVRALSTRTGFLHGEPARAHLQVRGIRAGRVVESGVGVMPETTPHAARRRIFVALAGALMAVWIRRPVLARHGPSPRYQGTARASTVVPLLIMHIAVAALTLVSLLRVGTRARLEERVRSVTDVTSASAASMRTSARGGQD